MAEEIFWLVFIVVSGWAFIFGYGIVGDLMKIDQERNRKSLEIGPETVEKVRRKMLRDSNSIRIGFLLAIISS